MRKIRCLYFFMLDVTILINEHWFIVRWRKISWEKFPVFIKLSEIRFRFWVEIFTPIANIFKALLCSEMRRHLWTCPLKNPTESFFDFVVNNWACTYTTAKYLEEWPLIFMFVPFRSQTDNASKQDQNGQVTNACQFW